MIGAPINVLAWQRAFAACPAIQIVTFEPARDTLRVAVQAAASEHAIPVRLRVTVSRQLHDVFDFEIDPHPIKTGGASLERIVKITVEHATSLAYRTAVARTDRELRRRRPA